MDPKNDNDDSLMTHTQYTREREITMMMIIIILLSC